MRETLRWIVYLVVATIAIVVIVFGAYRIRGPSRAQRDALTRMQKDYRPKHGTNAFPLLWYVEYDVPDEEIEARYDAEVKAERAASATRSASKAPPLSHEPDAKKLAEADADSAALCTRTAEGCLARAREETASMRAAVAQFPTMRSRAKAFEAADYFWNDFPPDSAAYITVKSLTAERIWLTAYALQYVDGDRTGALAGTCAQLGAWRRMHRGTNSLIASMTAIASAEGALRLFADMLAALPGGEPVPDACASALRPIEAADVDRCAEMAGEFAFLEGVVFYAATQAVAPDASWLEHAGQWTLVNAPQSQGWLAEQDARYCEEPPTSLLADVLRPMSSFRRTTELECISSVLTCILSETAEPAFDGYDARTLDYAAHLRLAATLLWLREHPGATFDQRPESLRSAHHASGYDAANGVLFVENLYRPQNGRYTFPITAQTMTRTSAP